MLETLAITTGWIFVVLGAINCYLFGRSMDKIRQSMHSDEEIEKMQITFRPSKRHSQQQ